VERRDIVRWNPTAHRVEAAHPDPRYEKAYALFRRLYIQTKDIARDLSLPD
jgi:xylulokinase